MTVATGHSHDLDSADAIAEALDACAETLGDLRPGAGLLFAGIDHDHQALLGAVEARHPGVQLVGCTTHGELSSDGFAEDSVALMLFHSERVQFKAGVGENTRTNPEAAREAVEMARDGLDAPVRLCIALPEGIGGADGSAPGTLPAGLLGALGTALGSDVPVCGGLAADQFRFTGTVQFCNGRVYRDAVPVLLMAGPVRVAAGVASGYEPVGGEHQVTDADGLVLARIDGELARDVWIRYFGSDDMSGARNAFVVYPDDGPQTDDRSYLCGPSHFRDDGALVTFSLVPVGARIRFATATRDGVLDGAAASAGQALAAFEGDEPDAALLFSCASRHVILGTWVWREIERLHEHVRADIPTVGLYTYGEIGPLAGSAAPFHHTNTLVTVLVGEEA